MPEPSPIQMLEAAQKLVAAEMGDNYEVSGMFEEEEDLWAISIGDKRVPLLNRKYPTMHASTELLHKIVMDGLSPSAILKMRPTEEESRARTAEQFGDGLDELMEERET